MTLAPERPTAALVLGSGGARGYTHIGVVQVLREAGVEIVAISGSSMGALVGGLLAAGKLDEFTEWALGLGQLEVLKLIDVSLTAPGAMRGEKMFRVVDEILGDVQIEDLPIDYTAVAVDLLAQREVWFQEGPLDIAIRASTAIPSIVAPLVRNGRVLVDGGLLNPVPVAPVAASRADLVIAVSLHGRGEIPGGPVSESAEETDAAEWSKRFRGTAARWFDSDLLAAARSRLSPERQETLRSRLSSDEADERPRRSDRAARGDDLKTVDVTQSSLEIMQGALTRHRLAGYAPDVLVTVPKNVCRSRDFHRAEEMIQLGRTLAEDALVDLLRDD